MKSMLSFNAIISCGVEVCDPTLEDVSLDEDNNSAKMLLGYLPDLWSERKKV